jgi:hypothetical protein
MTATSSQTTSASATSSVDVRVDAHADGVRSAVNVSTEEELAAYGESLRSYDEHIDQVEANVDGDVVLTYYHPVRLFGVIPLQAKTKTVVSVNNNGLLEAKTHLPWWSFLATGTGSVASSIDAVLANSGEVLTDMKLEGNATARARVLEAIAEAHARVRASTTSSFGNR